MFSRAKIKRYSHQRAAFIVSKLLLFFVSLAMMVILLWLRIDWGITNWAHHAYFSNFWTGIYISFAGFAVCLLNSLLACCFVLSSSNKLLVLSCVLGFASLLLFLIGIACMLTDALGKPVRFIIDTILEMIDNYYSNNVMANEDFLDHLYRIVGCCGAYSMEDYYDKNQTPPSSCIDRQHMGGIFYDRGCGYQFSLYMKTWAGCVSAVIALMFLLEILAIVLSYALIKFKNKTYKGEEESQSYSRKPLPPEPRERSGSGSHTYDLPPPLSTRYESLQTSGLGSSAANSGAGGESLRSSALPEEIPLRSESHGYRPAERGSRLEVADGVNLDSDSELEAELAPQIVRKRETSRSREPSISSAKLKYQSEIRNIIRSYQDLKSSNEHLSDESDSATNTDNPDFFRHHKDSSADTLDRVGRGHFQSHHAYHEEHEEPRYVDQRHHHHQAHQAERQTKSVLFGSNSMNRKIHDEFRQIAKRNKSFKIAMNSPGAGRRGSMKESIQRSMEDLHEGFVSLSGRSSRSGSFRSRTNSVTSLRSLEDLQHQSNQRRKYSDDSSSEAESRGERSGQRSQERLSKVSRNDIMSRSAAGLDIITRGLAQRKSSRERIVSRRRNSRSRSNSRENLVDRGRANIKQYQDSRSDRSRSKENILKTSSKRDYAETEERKPKKSFGKEFVNFYAEKLK